MHTAGKTILITGANRGIGEALVDEALKRDAARVYAGARRRVEHSDARVVPLLLDVTDHEHIRSAVDQVDDLDILINNAGVVEYVDDLTDPSVLDRMLAVNFYGVRDVVQAFLPKLTESAGAIVTNISLNAMAAFPLVPSQSISKTAAFSLMQSWRTILAPDGVSVHSVLTGAVDTQMTAGLDIDKAPPELVARGILEGMEKGEDDIFPDPVSGEIAGAWSNGSGKNLEGVFAALYRQVASGS